jgi:hypothetical protein
VKSVAPSAPPTSGGDTRARLLAAIIEAKQTYVADALEHSEIAESAMELTVTTPKLYAMNLQHGEFKEIVQRVIGKKVTIKIGETQRAPVAAAAPAPQADEVAARAMDHPEVKRFQELFPDSQVRTVRNLKDA